MVDTRDLKSLAGNRVPVRVRSPAPRQKNSAPFRFRGLRKSRENCTSAESFFLSETGVSRGTPVSVLNADSDLDSSGAPKRRESEQDSLLFWCRAYGGQRSASLKFLGGNHQSPFPLVKDIQFFKTSPYGENHILL